MTTSGRHPGSSSDSTDGVVFSNHEGVYSGLGVNGRRWRITPTLTGWRLEFRDPGDEDPTYAGTHATVAQAQREAAR